MRFWSSRLVVFGMLAGLLVAASAGCDLLTQLYGDDEGNLVQPPIATRGTAARWTVDIGTGDTTFIPEADGDPIAKQTGPQGGFHVWVALVLDGPTPATLEVQVAVSASGTLVSRSTDYVEPMGADAGPDAEKTVVGLRGFVQEDTVGPIVVAVEVIDPNAGTSASAQRALILK